MINEIKLVSHNGEKRASSSDVAKAFGKAHKNVLRAIDRVRSEIPNDFHKLNFEPVEIIRKNSMGQPYAEREVLMTRDGFSLIAMGFTGYRAMEWKIAYLKAFKLGEKAISEEIPRLQSLVSKLQSALDSQWKHRPKGLPRGRQRRQVTIPVERETLFGKETVWVEALREQASALQLLLAERSHILKVNRGLHKRLTEIEAKLEAPEKPAQTTRRRKKNVIEMLPRHG